MMNAALEAKKSLLLSTFERERVETTGRPDKLAMSGAVLIVSGHPRSRRT